MPIYEYHCSNCHHEVEVLQSIHDPAPSLCPACGGQSLQKKISAAGFKLKGSGWYETDFKGQKTPDKKTDAATISTDKTDTADTPQKSDKKETGSDTNT